MSKVGVYTRISRSKDYEYNESIENQIEGIKRYCKINHLTITKIYKDIGYSGSNFNRPGYIEMLNDIENEIIDTIIVKDLSRLGRDHLVVGKLIEEDLLINDIRLISLDDNYDNKTKIDEFIAFRNIFNEMYLKDLRKKMKLSIDHKAKTKILNQRKGLFYGLKEENNKIVIDEEPSKVIRLIFKLSSIDNYGDHKIAKIISNMNIINPSHYRYNKYNEKANLTNDPYFWSPTSIRNILLNEGYTGKLINQKYKNINGKTIINDNPIIIENGLPQIIKKETYQKALSNRKSHKRYSLPTVNNKYKNIINCESCNKAMRYTFIKHENSGIYKCIRCNNKITEEDLNIIIQNEIKELIKIVELPDKETLEPILASKGIIPESTNINILNKKLSKLNKDLEQLYEDYLLNNIVEDKFIIKKNNYEQNIKNITEEINKLSLKNNIIDKYYNELNNILNNKKKVDNEFVKKIVDRIKVVDGSNIIFEGFC